jgi:phosphoserine phosphatase RsbU/P
MKMRIRSKFVGILIIAALLPLGIAMTAFQWFGGRYYRKSQGVVFQAEATQLAQSLSQSIGHEVDSVAQWALYTDAGGAVRAAGEKQPQLNGAEFKAAIDAIEARWPSLPADSPEMSAVLDNDIARHLKEFQRRNPSFAEIFLTDRQGRLLAATNKTSDYWQADEGWWQEAAKLGDDAAHVEGLNFDASSGVYSIDVAVPLHVDGSLAGVLKGVVNASPFFETLARGANGSGAVREVVMDTGEVLLRLSDTALKPMTERVAPSVTAKFQGHRPGWARADVTGTAPAVMGFAPIRLRPVEKSDPQMLGLHPMWVAVYRDDASVMAPVHGRLRMVLLTGMGLAGVFVLAGYYIASRKIIDPITQLRRAAEAVSRTVKLDEAPPSGITRRLASKESAALLGRVESIKTGDEIEELASEFAFMGQRILSYHEKLESEIAEKTQEIRRDLDFARQFQENLMPREYPNVPGATTQPQPALSLHFNHIYKPASTVGGDFFDVFKLDDSRAGIFIADVMGHGARSALVTAIVATLLQDVERHGNVPAEVLRLLNQHFCKVVHNTGDVVFVSAFYLVLDIAERTATYASAGHPSPFLLDRAAGTVTELTPHLTHNPALGLFPDSKYQVFSRPIKESDLFLLFTDGLFECANSDGDEFGRDRLRRLVEQERGSELNQIMDAIVHAAAEFSGPGGLDDDVCLVGVEVCEKPALHPKGPDREMAAELAG